MKIILCIGYEKADEIILKAFDWQGQKFDLANIIGKRLKSIEPMYDDILIEVED